MMNCEQCGHDKERHEYNERHQVWQCKDCGCDVPANKWRADPAPRNTNAPRRISNFPGPKEFKKMPGWERDWNHSERINAALSDLSTQFARAADQLELIGSVLYEQLLLAQNNLEEPEKKKEGKKKK